MAGRSLAARLAEAIADGRVIRGTDGRLSLPPDPAPADPVGRRGGFILKRGRTERPCRFLNGFLFEQVYGRAAVPWGCRSCHKIKVATRSLRALMAVKDLAEATGETTKSGSEVDNPYNQTLFATYLYFDSLEAARRAYPALKAAIDRHADLGPAAVTTLKRGCSNYERACGPSDRYRFDPGQPAAEAYLWQRFAPHRPASDAPEGMVDALRLLRLVEIAYRIGDETYKDFTGGRPLHPPPVDYAPVDCAPAASGPAGAEECRPPPPARRAVPPSRSRPS